MSSTGEMQENKRFKTYDPQIRFSSIVVQKIYDAAHRIHISKKVGMYDKDKKANYKAWETMPEGEAKEQTFEKLIKEETIDIS